MAVQAVSIINNQNEQVFFRHYSSEQQKQINKLDTLNFQRIIYASFDIIDERRKNQTVEVYLGHLYSVDDYQVIGYVSSTHTKVLLVCREARTDANYRELLLTVYSQFVSTLLNPFQVSTQVMASSTFTTVLQNTFDKFNAAININKSEAIS